MSWVCFSALQSEADDNGQKHVILCRVILGNVEKVQAGSQQCHPSSEDFDTGADDLEKPKKYVVWFADMNRIILPECVVSYKSSDHLPGINGSSCLVCFDFCIPFSCLKTSCTLIIFRPGESVGEVSLLEIIFEDEEFPYQSKNGGSNDSV